MKKPLSPKRMARVLRRLEILANHADLASSRLARSINLFQGVIDTDLDDRPLGDTERAQIMAVCKRIDPERNLLEFDGDLASKTWDG